MRLIVVIGYLEESRSSKPIGVYAGRSSDEAEKAMEDSQAVLFEIIRNPITVRKRRKTPLPSRPPAPDTPPTVKESLPVAPEPVSAPAPVAEALDADAEAAANEDTAPAEDTAPPEPPPAPATTGSISGKSKKAA